MNHIRSISYQLQRRLITIPESTIHSSPHASLAVLGLKLRDLDLFAPIIQHVKIAQKTILHTPTAKLYDGFVSLLAGAHGLVETNSTLRADPVLQRAFGRPACAEQSVVQDTLDACTAAVVLLDQVVQKAVGPMCHLAP